MYTALQIYMPSPLFPDLPLLHTCAHTTLASVLVCKLGIPGNTHSMKLKYHDTPSNTFVTLIIPFLLVERVDGIEDNIEVASV